MSDGFGPTPPVKRWYKSPITWVVVGSLFIAFAVIGIMAPPSSPPSVDPSTCEFVLTPKRDDTFLRCPVPENMRIPNWPDKQAPLNKE